MKKIIVLFVLCGCITGAAFAQVAKGGTLWAATKSVAVRSSTGFFADTLGALAYGEQVTVLQVNGKWVEIRSVPNSSLSGWTASANLSAKRIVSTGNTNSASVSEVGLAGKGFNQEVENAYKASGQPLDYADVDKTETVTVVPDTLLTFLTDGRLSLGE